MDKSELDRRVEEEAGEARRRWYGREEGRVWKGLTETERSDWISVARPLVERIAELEQAPANVDAPQGETLIKRVGREVGPALDRYQACNGGNHSSMCAAIGPLVAANMGLEDEPREAREDGQSRAELVTVLDVRRREIDRLNGVIANLREVIAQASAAQTAGRDQASEIEELRHRLTREQCNAVAEIKRLNEELISMGNRVAALRAAPEELRADLTRERETVRKLLADNAALETTVDVLAGRLATRGQS